MRFPSFSDNPPDRGTCFYDSKFSQYGIAVPAVAWGLSPVGGPACADPSKVIGASLGSCVAAVNARSPHYKAANTGFDNVYRTVTDVTHNPRETRARSTIDLALAATVSALNAAGHNLRVETEYSLGSGGNKLAVPSHVDNHGANWLSGYPALCTPCLAELWGPVDYVVWDETAHRIVGVVEAKRSGLAGAAAAEQMASETLAAAVANYWGATAAAPGPLAATAAGMLAGVSSPRPTAGAGEHVVGIVSDGDTCMAAVLCGNKLNDNAVHRLPFAGIYVPGGADSFDKVVAATLYGLTLALHGNACA